MQYLIVLFLAATATALDYGHSYSYPYSYGGYYGHGGYGSGLYGATYGSGLYGATYGVGGYSYAPSYYHGGAAISKYIAPASYATTYAAPAVATSYAAPAAVSYVSRPATTYVAPKVATVAAAPAVVAAAPTYVAAAPRIQKYIAPAVAAAPAITSYAAPAVTSYAAPAVSYVSRPATTYVAPKVATVAAAPAVSYVSRPAAVVAAAPRIEKQQTISLKSPSLKTVHGAPHISFTMGHGKTATHGGVSSDHFGGSFNTQKTVNYHSSSFDSRKGSGFGFYGLDSSTADVSGDSSPKPGVTYSANKPEGSTFSSSSFGTDTLSKDKNSELDFPEFKNPFASADKTGVSTFSDNKPAVSSHSSDKTDGSTFSPSSIDDDSSSEDDFSEFEFKKLDTDSDAGISSFSEDKPDVSTGFDKDSSRYSKPEVKEFQKSDVLSKSATKPETVSSHSSGKQAFTSSDKLQPGRFQKVPDFKGAQISFKMGSTSASSIPVATQLSGKMFSRPFYGGYASGDQVKTQFLGLRPTVLYTEEPSYMSGSPAVSLRNKIFYLTDDSEAAAYDSSSPSLLYSGAEGSVYLDGAQDAYVLIKKK